MEEALDRKRSPGRRRWPEGLDFIQRRNNGSNTLDKDAEMTEQEKT